MKIAIVGAGIIGVTTAWELANDGHQVAVFERRNAVAEESSFANAGIVSPGFFIPWATPDMRAKMLHMLLLTRGAIKLRWPLGRHEMDWMVRWQRACEPQAYLRNRSRLQRLAALSRTRLHQIVESNHLNYEHSTGCLVLLRSKDAHRQVEPGLEVLHTAGTDFKVLDAEAARKIEPALSQETELAGAIHLPDGEVGNCRQFAALLKREAEGLGVRFHFGCDIAALNRAQPRTLAFTPTTAASAPSASQAPQTFDAVIICAGAASAALLQPLGLHIPLASIHGHSISAAVREPLHAPRSAVIDDHYKITIARLGQRVRIAGGAELGGSAAMHPAASRILYKVLQDWFPGAAHIHSGVQEWKGAQPMLPDGPPLLGPSGIPGIWLNLGHGASGWALACGSAKVLADLISGRDPEIPMDGLGIERLSA